MKVIKLVVDNEVLEKYNKYYFGKYERRRKIPIEKAIPPSLNRFIAMTRPAQNSLKQKYKEFSIWLASYYNIAGLKINKAQIIYTFFFPDHRRRDFDNLMLCVKFYNDGFVESGALVDDDGERIQIAFKSYRYDKQNPRLEMDIIVEE